MPPHSSLMFAMTGILIVSKISRSTSSTKVALCIKGPRSRVEMATRMDTKLTPTALLLHRLVKAPTTLLELDHT